MIAPVAWATGADIRVDEADASLLESLAKVKEVFRRFKYNFSFNGSIYPGKVISNRFNGSRTGLLFSAGVDSMTSYLRHKDARPDFISIMGLPDLPHFEERFWRRVRKDISCTANMDSISVFEVKTDMLRSLNLELLAVEFGFNWFVGAAFSLFLLGFTAPITAIRGIGRVIIASSYTEDYQGISGSHPLIDNSVSWADVRVMHDGFELSRQQKLRYLAQNQNRPYLEHLRVCWDNALETNCGDCEKCMRTITGLAVEGVDPAKCNFSLDSGTFPLMRDCFEKGKIALNASQVYMWKDVQNSIPPEIGNDYFGSRKFLAWLRQYDFSQYRANTTRTLLRNASRLFRYKRNSLPSVLRKLKSYWYIGLSRTKLL
jgi:hypothetical protein